MFGSGANQTWLCSSVVEQGPHKALVAGPIPAITTIIVKKTSPLSFAEREDVSL